MNWWSRLCYFIMFFGHRFFSYRRSCSFFSLRSISSHNSYTGPDVCTSSCYVNKFYESIGKPRFISAPMVDQSELAFRLLVRKNGADVAFSQMMHARNFMMDPKYRSECIDWHDYRNTLGNGDEEESRRLDQPLIVQFAGDNPETLVKAGRHVHHDVAAIDLNLGCPQRIAKTGNYGAYLLPNKGLIVKCLTAMVQELDCPITAKIRILSSDEETLDLCRAIEATGVSMLTVHGRTVESNKLFVGSANWDIIRKIKQTLSIPIIANGGIANYSDAIRCLHETGCDGVMSSEALLENPKLFSMEGDRMFREEYVRAQLTTVREYLSILNAHKLPRPLFQVTRSHLFKMLHRFMDGKANGALRVQLAEGDFETMQYVFAQLEERMATIDFDTQIAMDRGMISSTGWYYRHRDERAEKRILSHPRRRDISASRLQTTSGLTATSGYINSLGYQVLSANAANGSTDHHNDAGLGQENSQGEYSSNIENEAKINEMKKKEKLLALKARLTKKRSETPRTGEAMQSSSSSSSFSKFMAKVDT